MDKLTEQRLLIKRVMNEFAEWANGSAQKTGEVICLFDETHDYYLLARVIWGQYRCWQSVIAFVRLLNGKFWIEEDWTEDGLATDLLKEGISHQEIVLGFQPPEMRPYTEFAPA